VDNFTISLWKRARGWTAQRGWRQKKSGVAQVSAMWLSGVGRGGSAGVGYKERWGRPSDMLPWLHFAWYLGHIGGKGMLKTRAIEGFSGLH